MIDCSLLTTAGPRRYFWSSALHATIGLLGLVAAGFSVQSVSANVLRNFFGASARATASAGRLAKSGLKLIDSAMEGQAGLIWSLQTEVTRAQATAHECREECADLKIELGDTREELHRSNNRIRSLEAEVETLKTALDNKDADLIRYKRQVGEL